MLINASRSRDILECIASLSSDEVATPPDVANQILDLLPVEVWSNKDLKWLDPACKTGVFLREAARRLMEGLKDSIPDETERRKHIFTKMLHGYALTELTAQMSRRSLYYNKDASNKRLSVVPFKNEEGNIRFSGQDHPYNVTGKCTVCGAGKAVFGGPGNRERHAYDFIHRQEVEMKFDVVVGNPPYQIEDGGGGGGSAVPIYQLFVEQAFKLQPRYVAMIIPSRWFSGGKGLDNFREKMLASSNFRTLDIFFDSAELFPGVSVKGGICYFLWDSNYSGLCDIATHEQGVVSERIQRRLDENGDVLVPWNEAIPILNRVRSKEEPTLDQFVASRNPFGLVAAFNKFDSQKTSDKIKVFALKAEGYMSRELVQSNHQWIDKWKVISSKAYGAGDSFPHQILGLPIIAEPGSACTETYLVLGVFDTQQEAVNFTKYFRSRFFRFLVSLRKNTQNINKDKFAFVPVLPLDQTWSDEKLYARYDISEAEQEFIASKIRLMTDE
jgi:site-specific DNA-methyltransferase (adenine-specific)